MKFIQRATTLFAATALAAAGTLMAGAAPASAASITFSTSSGDGWGQIVVLRDGKHAGYMYWNSDPKPELGWPGDAFLASDGLADGYGIEAHLDSGTIHRIATTRGHSAGYESPWTTGNLTEGETVLLSVCYVKGSASTCSKTLVKHA
ncbi:hypothetical protein ACPXCP_27765 [Streptomyces sp. DT20]|uniref:hypothetical protein n=1 Tax=unclassified Streptomyces TaxID=2593676 RepID=UPI00093C3724|nr:MULTISPECIES: hypothetical protein [unclassified Streptomyces]OKK24182.1 hypothetical protein AMK09_04775 [Streptomyces sp. CB02488]WRZ12814.1 hypothetical protein OG892_19525 [Streptomyces sp. NBC_00341]